MSHYFFHLAFGDRLVPDEEGVELAGRSEARGEAEAIIREPSAAQSVGNPRRWAGWFLQVADEKGQFLRLPIGHPALEIAAPRRLAQSAGSKSTQPAASVPQVDLSPRSRPAGFVGGLSARQERAAQLLEHSRRLQHELSSLYATSMHLRQRARHLIAYARRVSAAWHDLEILPIANEVVGPLPRTWSLYRACAHGVVSDAPERADIGIR